MLAETEAYKIYTNYVVEKFNKDNPYPTVGAILVIPWIWGDAPPHYEQPLIKKGGDADDMLMVIQTDVDNLICVYCSSKSEDKVVVLNKGDLGEYAWCKFQKKTMALRDDKNIKEHTSSSYKWHPDIKRKMSDDTEGAVEFKLLVRDIEINEETLAVLGKSLLS